jgi:hypothetical protein
VRTTTAPLEWERWTATRRPNGKWILKSYFDMYLSAQSDGTMKADRTQALD